ncbi:hypothetical protein SARC_06197 [Sphaeroforma arctica JP610]|uniref:Charged multivesicular body protein 7 n=1 Tax=Sphaeroforma arctica JP610 TaxID=667725 RepID=A0A0L0FZT9_9EUKA|nr:hypothetical protein SARC_06197 [Sphaeroforma arctica JP610]KNC81488.1 hypothetical protein SARC_06197 [Sphaeroforma arctica JP610]|eukprot:XP_014155390.1 hypothetical protein SARC_06197 [Sphaeroforma arctica JP610]
MIKSEVQTHTGAPTRPTNADGVKAFEAHFRRKGKYAMDAVWVDLPPSREVNPELYDHMIAFWRENLEMSAAYGPGSRFVVNLELFRDVRWNGTTYWDENLGRILLELLSSPTDSAKLVRRDDVLRGTGVGAYLLSVMKWLASGVWGVDPQTLLSDGQQYVLLEALKTEAHALYQQRKYMEGGQLCTLTQLAVEEHYTTDDLRLMLAQLQTEGLCVTTTAHDQAVAKFATEEEPIPRITERDTRIVQLRWSIGMEDDYIAQLDEDIEKDNAELKTLVQRKAPQAKKLAVLSRRKNREKNRDVRASARHNLEHVLLELENAATNMAVMKAMTGAVQTHQAIQGVDTAEHYGNVMDDIADVMDTNNDISQAMSLDVSAVDADDDALLAELDALESHTTEPKQRVTEQHYRYPNIPQTNPNFQRESQTAHTQRHAAT